MRRKKVGFLKALQLLGATDIDIHSIEYDGQKETFGFFNGTGLNPAPFIFTGAPFKMGVKYYINYRQNGDMKFIQYKMVKDQTGDVHDLDRLDFSVILKYLGYALE